jgi:hypothetical protein
MQPNFNLQVIIDKVDIPFIAMHENQLVECLLVKWGSDAIFIPSQHNKRLNNNILLKCNSVFEVSSSSAY